ncbi:hypothetical protein [Thermocoleostomius sinensis]|uniref:Uncharacterized protein n=1 Tax=Thermocoleostomius sinensis A174 TaxID=2016057 RepID=A0A9E8ZNT9_9CYAN|nr:hypothetical protein [Thermocoleostomius sinensis]WAL61991.1 hypothetical protein OXH18_08395 [Thermocoleostomius sinensis A174]
MPTDHLEPYRQMARSIRFVPPLDRKQTWQKPSVLDSSSIATLATASVSPQRASVQSAASGMLPHLLPDHTTRLIQAAVSRQTVLPPIYVLPESIADRISRLTDAELPCSEPIRFQPKIPQPDPNWMPAMTEPAVSIDSVAWEVASEVTYALEASRSVCVDPDAASSEQSSHEASNNLNAVSQENGTSAYSIAPVSQRLEQNLSQEVVHDQLKAHRPESLAREPAHAAVELSSHLKTSGKSGAKINAAPKGFGQGVRSKKKSRRDSR